MRPLLLFIVVLCATAAAIVVRAQPLPGSGRTYGEAWMNARMNAGMYAMGQQIGRDLGAMANLKADLSARIATARAAYWEAEYAGRDTAPLEEAYRQALWEKDIYFLVIKVTNTAREALSGQSTALGLGDLIDKLTFTDLDGGIPGYAKTEFDGWAMETYREFVTTGLASGLNRAHPSYERYHQRRNRAEFLFENPRSPLRSSEPGEYFAGWLMATDSVGPLTAARAESAAAQRIAGTEAFTRVVGDLRRNRLGGSSTDFSIRELRDKQVNWWLQLAMVDWQLTRHDAPAYGLYLIKRWMGCDWATAEQFQAARMRRLGSETVMSAVREAHARSDATEGKFLSNPYLQQMKSGVLLDPVAEKFGQFTIWEDALDVAAARMDRDAMRRTVQEYLASVGGTGTPEERYARVIRAVDETLLLAAVHHQQAIGLEPLVGYRRDPHQRWAPFQETLRILEGFAAARDDRTYAVRELLGVPSSASGTPLEQAVAAYEALVAANGEAAVLRAAHTTRQAATMTHKGIMEPGDAFRRQLGQGADVAREQARAQRQQMLQQTEVALGLTLTGGRLKDAILSSYVEQELWRIRGAEPKTSRPTQAEINQAYRVAQPKLDATYPRTKAALDRAVAAYERFEASGRAEDKQEADIARANVLDEIRFGYDLLVAADKTSEGAIVRQNGFSSVLDFFFRSQGDVLRSVEETLALYGAPAASPYLAATEADWQRNLERLAAAAPTFNDLQRAHADARVTAFREFLKPGKGAAKPPAWATNPLQRLAEANVPSAQVLWAERMVDFDGTTARFRGGEAERAMLQRAANAGSVLARTYLSAAATTGSGPPSPASSYKVNDRIEVEWQGQWYKARITELRGGDSYKISYDGYGREWDEWVTPKRMRKAR